MRLTNKDKYEASTAMCRGDTFHRGDVILFPLDGEYCVQRTVGPVSDENRIITKSWDEALNAFEMLSEGGFPTLHEYTVRVVMTEMTVIAKSPERAEEIAMEIFESDARPRLDHSLFVECCEVDDQGPSDEDEETEV